MREFMAWLKIFRVTNLPTVPGDALAGAAFLIFLSQVTPSISCAVASSISLLFLYMFGLADNDIVGGATDVARPIPLGEVSSLKVRIASVVCLILSLLLAFFFSLPLAWYVVFLFLTIAILIYNRSKMPLLMGLCRGLGVASGMCAVSKGMTFTALNLLPLSIVVLGWAFYITGVTKLSEGEEGDSSGLSLKRYFWGAPALLPIAAFLFVPYSSELILPIAGCVFTFIAWCFIVFPLSQEHTSQMRMQAVGKTIGALLYMQIGFMFIGRMIPFVAAACILWLTARFIKKSLPFITGS
jgi:hypothetical protein